MSEFSDSIAIAYPARLGVQYTTLPPDPHTTVMYLGEKPDVTFDEFDIMTALADIDFDFLMVAEIEGKEMFGPNQDIPVLRVQHTLLEFMHQEVKDALATKRIYSASAFNDYKPHITVDEATWQNPPGSAILLPAELWWGDERISLGR